MSVYFKETTRRYIPERCHLHTRRRENLKAPGTFLCRSNTEIVGPNPARGCSMLAVTWGKQKPSSGSRPCTRGLTKCYGDSDAILNCNRPEQNCMHEEITFGECLPPFSSETFVIPHAVQERNSSFIHSFILSFKGAYSPGWTFALPFCFFLKTHIQTHGRTPLDE
jgi:hypothetical protein